MTIEYGWWTLLPVLQWGLPQFRASLLQHATVGTMPSIVVDGQAFLLPMRAVCSQAGFLEASDILSIGTCACFTAHSGAQSLERWAPDVRMCVGVDLRQVDVLSWSRRGARVHAQLKDICAILSGLMVAQDYKRGQQLLVDRDFSDNATFFQVHRAGPALHFVLLHFSPASGLSLATCRICGMLVSAATSVFMFICSWLQQDLCACSPW